MAAGPQCIGSAPGGAARIPRMNDMTQGRRVSIGHAELYVEAHGAGEPLLLVAGLGGVRIRVFRRRQLHNIGTQARIGATTFDVPAALPCIGRGCGVG